MSKEVHLSFTDAFHLFYDARDVFVHVRYAREGNV